MAYYQNSKINNVAHSCRVYENHTVKSQYELCYKLKYVCLCSIRRNIKIPKHKDRRTNE
jgi:hypothetical protein